LRICFVASEPYLYIFIDESGNFEFSVKGSAFYTFTALLTYTPNKYVENINQLRLDIVSGNLLPKLSPEYLENNLCSHFHATEDRQPVRDLFFDLICHMDNLSVNAVVVRKNRTNPTLRNPHQFYPKFLGSLLDYIFQVYKYNELCIFVAGAAVTDRKKQFIKTIKEEINKRHPRTPYRIYFPNTASHCYLQIVDYINWAIFKKWESSDGRSYKLIKKFLQSSERDIFRYGDTDYY
jgi:hypothetical protein